MAAVGSLIQRSADPIVGIEKTERKPFPNANEFNYAGSMMAPIWTPVPENVYREKEQPVVHFADPAQDRHQDYREDYRSGVPFGWAGLRAGPFAKKNVLTLRIPVEKTSENVRRSLRQ